MHALRSLVSAIEAELFEFAFITLAKFVNLLSGNRIYTPDGCLNAAQIIEFEQVLRRVRSLSRDRYNKQVLAMRRAK
jgi:hypothetical protein